MPKDTQPAKCQTMTRLGLSESANTVPTLCGLKHIIQPLWTSGPIAADSEDLVKQFLEPFLPLKLYTNVEKSNCGKQGLCWRREVLVLWEFKERWLVGAGEDGKGRGCGSKRKVSKAWHQGEEGSWTGQGRLISVRLSHSHDLKRLRHTGLAPAHSYERSRVSPDQTQTIFSVVLFGEQPGQK